MTTNQTIDGVPRKLLESLLTLAAMSASAPYRELRALLDAPAAEERGTSHGFEQSPNTCRHDERSGVWWREGSITRTGRECCACGSVEEDPVEPPPHPQGEQVAMSREQFEAWVLGREHPTYGWLDKHWLALGDNPETYADPYVQGLWVASQSLYAEHPAPVATTPIQEDRETLIGYGRSSGLDEASTLCSRMAYAAYYPPGTRFKMFTPKAQKVLGDLLIKAANEIASLPGGPYERFKARQAKKAEPAKSQ